MSSVSDHLAGWRDNERAFQAAVNELKDPAAEVGLVLSQPHNVMRGWPHALHAEVRRRGSLSLLSCLDVGLSAQGEMLLQTIPGEARTFASFRPRDKDFYVKSIRRLVEAALDSEA